MDFLLAVKFFRVAPPRLVSFGNDLSFPSYRFPERDVILPRAPFLDRLVDHNSCQPGREARLSPKLVKVTKGFDEGVLHHFLGVLNVSEHSQGNAEDATLMHSD